MSRPERLTPLSGAGFAILTAAAFLVIGRIPDSAAPVAKITSFYSAQHSHLYVGGILLAYAALFFALFGVAVWVRIRRTGRHLVLAGAALAGTCVATASQLAVATTYFSLGDLGSEHGVSAGALQALHILGSELALSTAGGVELLLLAISMAGVISRVFPRWLAWPALIIGLLQLVIPVGFLAFLLFLPWTIVAAVVMILRASDTAPAVAHHVSAARLADHAAANS